MRFRPLTFVFSGILLLCTACSFSNAPSSPTLPPTESQHSSAPEQTLRFLNPTIQGSRLEIVLQGQELRKMSGLSASLAFDPETLQFLSVEKHKVLDDFLLTTNTEKNTVSFALASAKEADPQDQKFLTFHFLILKKSATVLSLGEIQVFDDEFRTQLLPPVKADISL